MRYFGAMSFFIGVSILSAVIGIPAIAQNSDSVTAPTKSPSTIRLIGNLTPALLEEDPRLKQKQVQLVAPRIYLQELFMRWTEQTGVSFEAHDNPQDDSGRWRVMICLRDAVSVGDAMDALRSALSQQGATWEWHRTGVAPNFSYRLVRPGSLEKLEASLRAEVQADYQGQLELAKKALSMSPEELKNAAKTDETGLLDIIAKDQDIRDGLGVFLSNFNVDQQDSIMRDNKEIHIPVNNLDAQGKAFTEMRTQKMNELNRGRGQDFGAATEVSIKTVWFPYLSTPALVIEQDNVGGWGYIGGAPMEKRWKAKLSKRLLLNGDDKSASSDLLAQKIKAPLPEKENLVGKAGPKSDADLLAETMIEGHDAEKCLSLLANAQSPRINFIARLAQKNSINCSMPRVYGSTVGQLLEELGGRSMATKWRHNILLFGYTAGFSNDDNLSQTPPYALVHYLMEHLAAYGEAQSIPLADMVALSKIATREQIVALDKEYRNVFPFLYWIGSPNVYDLFERIGKKPSLAEALESDRGVLVSEFMPDLRVALSIPTNLAPGTRLIVRQKYGSTNLVPPPAGTVCSFILQPDTQVSGANAESNVVFQFGYMTPRTPKELAAEQKKEAEVLRQRQSRWLQQ